MLHDASVLRPRMHLALGRRIAQRAAPGQRPAVHSPSAATIPLFKAILVKTE